MPRLTLILYVVSVFHTLAYPVDLVLATCSPWCPCSMLLLTPLISSPPLVPRIMAPDVQTMKKAATTRFILPCIENTLVDAREAVVARGLRCLASLAGLGLLPRYALPGQVKAAAPLLQHPGLGVRTSAVELCVRAAEALGSLDTQVFLHPVLRPHFR